MSVQNPSCFPFERHTDVEDEMSSDFRPSNWGTLIVLKDFKGDANINHLFVIRLTPDIISIFLVDLHGVFKTSRYFNAVLVSRLASAYIDGSDDCFRLS